MAASAASTATGPAFAAAILAMAVIVAALVYRPAATLAVLLAATAILLSEPSPLLAALSGWAAAAYLVLRHAATGTDTVTAPTVLSAAGFAVAGLAAASFPLPLPWLPLLAPLAAFGAYLLAVRPFVA